MYDTENGRQEGLKQFLDEKYRVYRAINVLVNFWFSNGGHNPCKMYSYLFTVNLLISGNFWAY